jgi:RNA polymerase-binding transcription factor DksA
MHENELKWTPEMLEDVTRDSEKWNQFVDWQKQRILERLSRYNNVNTVKTQLSEQGEPTPYQNYKISVVSNFLQKALKLIENGSYGVCINCNKEIPVQRLLLVPGALSCMECENKKSNKNKPWENG